MFKQSHRSIRRTTLTTWHDSVSRFGEKRARELLRASRMNREKQKRAASIDAFSLIHRLIHAAVTPTENVGVRRKKLKPIILDILWVSREARLAA